MTPGSRARAKFRLQFPARRFSLFLATGLVNTAVGYGIYLVGILANAAPVVALAIATVLGTVFNYASTGFVVFDNRSFGRMPHFIAAYALVFVLNATALVALTAIGLGPAVAQMVLLPFAAILSFALFHLFVFRKGKKS